MDGLAKVGTDSPRSDGEARANFSVREAENGFIAAAHAQSHVPFKRAGREGDGAFYEYHYTSGNSGEFVYSTLEEAFKDAEKILNLAKAALQAEEATFRETMGVLAQG